MIRKISKAAIIRALETEPLRPGDYHRNTTNAANKTCEVCAVGAILRQLKWNFNRYEAKKLIGLSWGEKSNEFLENLSDEYERSHWNEKFDYDLARLHAISFGEGFFPKVLEVELD